MSHATSIQWKRAVWAAGLTVLFTALLNLLAAQRLVEYRNAAKESLLIVQRLGALRGHLLDVETGQRGYLLAGEDAYLEPFRVSTQSVSADLDTLSNYMKSGRLSAAEVAAVARISQSKIQELDTTVKLRAAGKQAEAIEIVRTNRGKALMDSARALIQHLSITEEATFATQRDATDRWYNIVLLIVLCGAALTVGVLIFLYRTLTEYDQSQRAASREMEMQMQELEQFQRAQHARGGGHTSA